MPNQLSRITSLFQTNEQSKEKITNPHQYELSSNECEHCLFRRGITPGFFEYLSDQNSLQLYNEIRQLQR